MQKEGIGKSGLKASRIALGTWSMGGDAQWGKQDDAGSLEAIKYALNQGINLIDTAPAYGFHHSENLVGQVLKGFKREDVLIETKCGVWWKDEEGTPIVTRDGKTIRRNLSRRAILRDFEDSLKNLGTDYVDIYVTHQQSMPPFEVPIEETMDTLLELKKQGKIRAIGVSNATEEQLREYLRWGQIDLIQERYSMLDRGKMESFRQLCEENGITMQAYSPLEQGLLTGKIRMDYVVEEGNVRNKIAWFQPEKRKVVLDMLDSWGTLCEKYKCSTVALVIAWTIAQGMNVICGGRKTAHIADYIAGGELEIEAQDLHAMTEALNRLG